MRTTMQATRTGWRHFVRVGWVVVALSSACSSQKVFPAHQCVDPCCGGAAEVVDCGEHPTLACHETGEACRARRYGCQNGVFYLLGPDPSATCGALDGSPSGDEPSVSPADDATADDTMDRDVRLDSSAKQDAPSTCVADGSSDVCTADD